VPIYDYTCARCGRLTEVLHGIHEAGPRFCPNCGAEGTMRKGVTAAAVHFKGSGWAKKDRSAASSASAAKSKPAAESGQASDGGDGAMKGSSTKDSATKESATKESSSTSQFGSTAAASGKDGGD
jgi:putative FmdB family regulatory protein